MAAMVVPAGREGKTWDDTGNNGKSVQESGNCEAGSKTAPGGGVGGGAGSFLPGFSGGREGDASATGTNTRTTAEDTTSSALGNGVSAQWGGGTSSPSGGTEGFVVGASGSSPPPPPVGIPTTCPACTAPRVARRVTCHGCQESFHWTCMGFYDHKYRRPGANWRCKSCKGGAEAPPPPPPPGEPPAASRRASESGDAIRSCVAAAASAVTPEQPVAVSETTASPVQQSTPMSTRPTSTATPSGGGERVCPVCTKDIGRKRTMDCSVCHTPSHASCVNVRGAETPLHWVCRQCQPLGNANGSGTENGQAGVTNGEFVAVTDANTAEMAAGVVAVAAGSVAVAHSVRRVCWSPASFCFSAPTVHVLPLVSLGTPCFTLRLILAPYVSKKGCAQYVKPQHNVFCQFFHKLLPNSQH